jgi:hypothetical protein
MSPYLRSAVRGVLLLAKLLGVAHAVRAGEQGDCAGAKCMAETGTASVGATHGVSLPVYAEVQPGSKTAVCVVSKESELIGKNCFAAAPGRDLSCKIAIKAAQE